VTIIAQRREGQRPVQHRSRLEVFVWRDLFWLVLICLVSTAWWLDRTRLAEKARRYEEHEEEHEKAEEFDRIYRDAGRMNR
jgi:hypothetical protein